RISPRVPRCLRSCALVRKLVLEELHSGEVLEVWIINPAFAHAFVGTVSQFQAGRPAQAAYAQAASQGGGRSVRQVISLLCPFRKPKAWAPLIGISLSSAFWARTTASASLCISSATGLLPPPASPPPQTSQ